MGPVVVEPAGQHERSPTRWVGERARSRSRVVEVRWRKPRARRRQALERRSTPARAWCTNRYLVMGTPITSAGFAVVDDSVGQVARAVVSTGITR